jgi:hypothetical protein
LRKYGDPFLRGDRAFYARLEEENRRRSADYTNRQMLDGARKDAEVAWREKDFARVVEIYGNMRGGLTAIEAKRLAYAEKRRRHE